MNSAQRHRMLEEIKKCDVLCEQCHKKEHMSDILCSNHERLEREMKFIEKLIKLIQWPIAKLLLKKTGF